MTALRGGVCVLAAALGVAALALAHDLHAWRDAIAGGDARFAAHPTNATWETSTWLPQGAAQRALGIGDDLRLRRAERSFEAIASVPPGIADGQRAGAEVALADVVVEGASAQASRAGNLLGILSGSDWSGGETALATFDAAVRADLANTYAKHNLELVLRRLRLIGIREGASGTIGGDYGQGLAGAGAGLPGSGY